MTEAGSKLAHYEISSALGKGGMGEVFRARDTKLGREVAIKTLPEEYSQDPDRLARFQREARFLATLDHPNIAGIHGLEESGETRFLVLELVEGETLAERIHERTDKLTTRQALEFALQIAQALEVAHGKGVVHRDLKPANVKVTPGGQVKVLDFGLAKALDTSESSGPGDDVNISNSPTLSVTTSGRGVLLGTAAYMAPEQARGETLDSRADVWAFGCVLFEMLAGAKAFEGRTVSDILAAVLKSEPDWSRLPDDVHPRIRFLLERCLRKEARERCPRVAEVRSEIAKVLVDPGGVSVETASARLLGSRSRLAVAAAIIVTALVGGVAVGLVGSSEPTPVMRFGFDPVDPIPGVPEVPVVAFAPDGSRLAYSTLSGLWVRGIEETTPVALPGPTGWIGTPAFSPDGLSLAYVNGSTAAGPFSIMRVPVGGGSPQTLHIGLETVPTDLDWDSRDILMYTQPDGIWEVAAAGGGDARLVIAAGDGETLGSPQFLAGEDSILFTATAETGPDRWNSATIAVAAPGSPERATVWEGGSDSRYVPTGHLVFADGPTLWAVAFDPGSAQVTGERFRVVDQVLRPGSGESDTAQYAVSDSGSLVHLGVGTDDPAATAAGNVIGLGAPQGLSIVWVDRMGNEELIDVAPDRYAAVRVSPDGTKAAVVIGGNPMVGEPRDVWVVDLETQDISRLTDDGLSDAPVWLGNDRLLFRTGPPPYGVYVMPMGGGARETIRVSAAVPTAYPISLTPDGETLLVLHAPSLEIMDIMTLPIDGSGDFMPLLDDVLLENMPTVSPNGQFVAYQEGPDVGTSAIVVRPYPDVELRSYPVGPGQLPIFSRDGTELFYFDGSGVSSVPVQYEPFDLGTPASLGLPGPYFFGANRTWDEGPDGRFLMTRMGTPNVGGELQVHVVIGFSQVLEERTQ